MFVITPEEMTDISVLPIASSAKECKSNQEDILDRDEIKIIIRETILE